MFSTEQIEPEKDDNNEEFDKDHALVAQQESQDSEFDNGISNNELAYLETKGAHTEEIMPCTTKSSKSPVVLRRSSRTPKKTGVADVNVDDLAMQVSNMAIACTQPFSFDKTESFKVWNWDTDNAYFVVVHFFFMPLPCNNYRIEMSPDGNQLFYYCGTPDWYADSKHLKFEKEAEGRGYSKTGVKERSLGQVSQNI